MLNPILTQLLRSRERNAKSHLPPVSSLRQALLFLLLHRSAWHPLLRHEQTRERKDAEVVRRARKGDSLIAFFILFAYPWRTRKRINAGSLHPHVNHVASDKSIPNKGKSMIMRRLLCGILCFIRCSVVPPRCMYWCICTLNQVQPLL